MILGSSKNSENLMRIEECFLPLLIFSYFDGPIFVFWYSGYFHRSVTKETYHNSRIQKFVMLVQMPLSLEGFNFLVFLIKGGINLHHNFGGI